MYKSPWGYSKFEVVSKEAKAFFWHPEGDVREVTIVDCDFDKRVEFRYEDGTVDDYKWGYFYNTYEDALAHCEADYDKLSLDEICSLPDSINPYKLLLSKKNYSAWLKAKRKEKYKNNIYMVHLQESFEEKFDPKCHEFKTLKKALNFFSKIDENVIKLATLSYYKDQHLYELAEVDNKQMFVIEQESKWCDRMLKSFHLGKAHTYKQWRK